MADKSKIKWTNSTWNPITGCSVVSAACKNCYAMKLAGTRLQHHPSRAGLTQDTANGPVWTGEVRFNEGWLDQPLRWRKPRKIFVCAHSDLFHESVPVEWIDKVFAVMALAKQHTFQVLTKRPERMLAYCSNPDTPTRIDRLKHVIEAGRLHELNAPERILPIDGWAGYFVSSKGRVLSDRTNGGTRREGNYHELKPQLGEKGHARVMLQVNGATERPLVHRLVLTHFDRQPHQDEQGCHLDGDPTNNALWNLKWGDQPDNWNDSKRHGTRRRYSKLNQDDIAKIRARLDKGESAYSIAPDFGVSDTQIRNIARGRQWQPEYQPEWPLQSVWLGVTVENQQAADERIPLLLQTPAALRWVSMEPLLGAVDLHHISDGRGFTFDALSKKVGISLHGAGLDWVVVGGESGRNARPMHPDWARTLRDQCEAAAVPFFFKQWGEWQSAAAWVQGGICLDKDGRELKNYKGEAKTIDGGDWRRARGDEKFSATIMHRVGAKASGNLLDGVLHEVYPRCEQ